MIVASVQSAREEHLGKTPAIPLRHVPGRRRKGGQGGTGKALAGVSIGLLAAGLSDVQAALRSRPGRRLRSGIGLCPGVRVLAGRSCGRRTGSSLPPRSGIFAKAGRSSEFTSGRRTAASRASTASSPPSLRRHIDAHRAPVSALSASRRTWQKTPTTSTAPARAGELILDCIVLSPNQWWVGFHRAKLSRRGIPAG